MEFGITLFGRRLELTTKALQLAPLSSRGNSWWPWGVIRESFTGAWQQNVEVRADTVLTNPTVFACITLIAADVSKLTLRLVEQDDDDVWTPTYSAAFSPVLRKPNRYQIITKFIEQWIVSKLSQGNTYVLLQRDQRRVVVAMYILDPARVKPLVTPDGAVYYQLRRDDLSGLATDTVVVPASEIIHDRMVALFHPLIGVTPIYACGAAAVQGLSIQSNSSKFFGNGSNPGGVLTAPGSISDETAARLKAYWDANYTGDNVGKVAVLGDGLKYESMHVNAVDSALIQQLGWSDERICSTFHTPAYMVGVGPPPPYANIEPLLQAYYAQCLQNLIVNLEKSLDDGIGIAEKVNGTQYGTELDIADLIWMDAATRTKAAGEGIRSGMSVDEVRRRYYGLPGVTGGDVVYMQQQNHSLEALAALDAATIRQSQQPTPIPAPAVPTPDPGSLPLPNAASYHAALRRKALEAGLVAA